MASDKEPHAGESSEMPETENGPAEKRAEHEAEAPEQSEEVAPEKSESGEGIAGPEAVEEESGFRRGVRRIFRALAMVVIIFGLGMLFTYFTFLQPRVQTLNEQIQTLETENQGLSGRVEQLQGEVDSLGPLEDENQVLTESLADSQIHVRLLAVLADVRAAQISLSIDDRDLARSQLAGVPDGLEALGSLLPSDRQGELVSMLNRANLAIEEIETDAFAAQSDLEVLANSLIQLENSLFVTP
jgi:cell division protein FtsB